ncbi:MAG: hypothetical protein ACREA9_15180, partial [Pyrinomonadaceae bacterium]
MRAINPVKLVFGFAILVIATTLLASPFIFTSSAKKAASGSQPASRAAKADVALQDANATSRAEALAILQSDYFDEMSSAGQMNIERMAGARKIEGVIKPYDFSSSSTAPAITDGFGVAPSDVAESPDTSSFVDPLVNNPAADMTAQNTQSETAIVLGSGNNVVSAFNDSGSFLGGVSKFTGFSTSANSGTAWTDQGALPTNVGNGDAGDPGLARNNTTGTILFTTLNFNNNDNLNVYRSTDNGVTFPGAPANGAPGLIGAAGN